MGDLSRRTARTECSLDIIKSALDEGLDPNVSWGEFDINEPHPRGGCVVPAWTPPWDPSWANWNTPLHMALWRKHLDAAEFLLENGADVELKNALGRTALHDAASRGDHDGAELLIKHGANVNAVSEARKLTDQDCDREGIAGVVPLHEAVRKADLRMVTVLIEARVDLDITTTDGWTILDLALLERNEEIVDLLVKSGARLSKSDVADEDASAAELEKEAQILLVDNSMFPPVSCHKAYVHVLRQPELVASWESLSKNPDTGSKATLDTFLALLSHLAKKPNPENVPGATYCTKCTEFQRVLSPENLGPFDIQSDRKSLSTSAANGCRLCAIFDDALINKCGQWALSGSSYDHGKKPQVTLMAIFSSFMGEVSISVYCGKQHETVQLFRLSDSFYLDNQKVPENKDLGTDSPQASHTARAWIEHCQLHHDTCSKGREENPLLPGRVIDVGTDTISPFIRDSNGERGPYVTLSYVRGDSTNYETTPTSLPERQQDLLRGNLPQAFLDAIIVTRNLGIRYLWIDKICVLPDESAPLQSIFGNSTVTISAHSSPTAQDTLFQPRPQHTLTTPVQISLRVPKRLLEQHSCPTYRTHYSVLPVAGEKLLYTPGAVEDQASTLQEHTLSTRIIHFGPGILFWECLSAHGSEADPEGDTHVYRSSCTNFMDVREHRRILLGKARERDTGTHLGYSYDNEEDDSEIEDEDEEEDAGLGSIDDVDEEEDSSDDEDGDLEINEDLQIDDDEDTQEEAGDDDDRVKKLDPKTLAFNEWRILVSKYTSHTFTSPASKIPDFLGLSKYLEPTLCDSFIAGIWQKQFFLSSLLWSAMKPGGMSRNDNYSSWTWASVNGKVTYPSVPSKVVWQPSEILFDVDIKGPAQNSVTGSISMRTTLRIFPKDYKFWRYSNGGLDAFWSYMDKKNMSKKRIAEEMMVVNGSRDLRAASEEAKRAGGWEGAKEEVYCVVVARFGKVPPPRFGYPAFPGGRPQSLACLCLTPVRGEGEGEGEGTQPKVFRRVGWCHFWDGPAFWEGAQKNEWVTIV